MTDEVHVTDADTQAADEFPVPGGDTLPLKNDGIDAPPYGCVIVVLNVHGAAEAFGPYGEDEAHEIAELTERLVPTWLFVLDECDDHRYGKDGVSTDLPRRSTVRPTRPREWRDE